MFLISYDLKSAQADYEAMYTAIQQIGPSMRLLESTWVVNPGPEVTEDQISDRLRNVIHEGDRYIVSYLDSRRQGWLAKSMWEWMRQQDASSSSDAK